jgi:putative hemolysin
MPTSTLPLMEPSPILCGACGDLALCVLPNGDFGCVGGHAIRPESLVLDPDETWCVLPDGSLSYITDPAAAYRDLCEARDSLVDPENATLLSPERVYVEAVEALRGARALGLTLPAGAEQIGQGR